MNNKEQVISKLKGITKKEIIITPHALIRMIQRQISEEEVIENILNPIRLEYAIACNTDRKDEEKFDCYFRYSNNLYHRYILAINKNIIIITAIKLNMRWQTFAEKKIRG